MDHYNAIKLALCLRNMVGILDLESEYNKNHNRCATESNLPAWKESCLRPRKTGLLICTLTRLINEYRVPY